MAGNPYRPGREHTARTHPVVPAIYQTTTFELDDAAYADIQGGGGLHQTWYSRFGNPTVDAAAAEVARLHGASRSLMTSSGMAAIATTLITLLRSGDTLVAARQVYGDTDDLLTRDLPGLGIEVVRVDASNTAAWRPAGVSGVPVAASHASTSADRFENRSETAWGMPAISGT